MKKTLTLLIYLFIIGCEMRSADPEMESLKAWLLTEEARIEIANAFENFGDLLDRLPPGNPNLRGRPKSLDQLAPIESWTIKRVVDDTDVPFSDNQFFAIFTEGKERPKGWFYYLSQYEGKVRFDPAGLDITKSEFENLGNPVSRTKANALIEAWWREGR